MLIALGNCCKSIDTLSSTVPYSRLKRSQSASGRSDEKHEEEIAHIQPAQIKRSFSRSPISDADWEETVVLKMGVIGDPESGKTCLISNYVGEMEPRECYRQTSGIVAKEKVSRMKNATIIFNLWELGGQTNLKPMLQRICQDAAAILIVFDLTRRSTLNSVKDWFVQSQRWNRGAMPVVIGTKYDEFVNFPSNIQLAITKQAIFYARMMGAPLFFSSSLHNINVRKIFKVIVAKLFDLPCNICKNHTIGEPIIHY